VIFATAVKEPAVFIMLSEQDVKSMRDGRTLFVDERATKGATFKKVILSLHRTDQEAIKLVETAQGRPMADQLVTHEPRADDVQCTGCLAMSPYWRLFEEKCIICWATEAKKLRIGNN
jgi:hypothetical protein